MKRIKERKATIYGDGEYHKDERTGELRRKISRNMSEVILPSGSKVYEVKYSLAILHTKRRFGTPDEMYNYNAICQDLINRKRINDKFKPSKEELLDYPENLLKELGITPESHQSYYDDILPNFDRNWAEKVETRLTERESDFIRYLYRDGLTLQEIGNKHGIGRERVRQIITKGIMRIKHSSLIKMLTERDKYYLISQSEKDAMIAEFKAELRLSFEKMTYEEAKRIVAEHESKKQEKAFRLCAIPIEEADFSLRTLHCLRRHCVKYLGELQCFAEEDMMKIRNLGKKSLKEVKDKLAEYGLSLAEARDKPLDELREEYIETVEGNE